MRAGQNKRMRGRNNRRGPNPLTRTYESNGPDVKVRGTAQHVAEKYLQLARDAQSSGDPVMAESYLQHAEHYFRLIAAAQQAQQQQAGFNRPQGESADADDMDDDDDGGIPDRFASPFERNTQPVHQPQNQPQPVMNPHAQPFEGQSQPVMPAAPQGERQQHDRPPRHERNFNNDHQPRMRPNREERPHRPPYQDNRQQGNVRPPQPAGDAGMGDQPAAGLPAFITGGRPAQPAPAFAAPHASGEEQTGRPGGESEGEFNPRGRRRRRSRDDGEETPARAPASESVQGE
ncbi:MAG: DUF4167 domain-containing protein [Alphaproteobacteria bacterium]|nr:DUF4167 domain-containing protein [Alphaproteobacteria bacterium]